MRVSAEGGTASPLTKLDPSRNEDHHSLPFFLPDGRHFVYLRNSSSPENTGAYVGSLDAKPENQNLKPLLVTPFGPAFVPTASTGPGQMIFVRDGALLARPFDPDRLEFSGEPIEIAEQVRNFIERGLFSVSANSVLVYRSGGERPFQPFQLTWIDRQGKVQGTPTKEQAPIIDIAVSPDTRRVALSMMGACSFVGVPCTFPCRSIHVN